ncbi:MAG: hypothetical protein GX564_04985 [Oligosphaeraceae bacterium]|nr:hypothetical protein [Oligosphaeraceae bacterium]
MADFISSFGPPKRHQPWRRRLQDFALNGGIWLALLLFGGLSLAGTRRLARCLVFLSRPFLGSSSRIIEANLKLAFPDKSAAEIAALRHRNLCFMIELACDFLQSLKHPHRIEQRLLPVIVPAEYPPDQPLLFCLPHLGNWEILARMIPRTGRRCAAVTGVFRSRKLNELMTRGRSACGIELIPNVGAAVKVRAAIQDRKSVGLLIDQNISPKHGGVFVNFFSLPAPTSRLPASIALQLHVPVLAGACIKQDDGNFALLLQPLPKPAWEYSDVNTLTEAILEANAQLIRQHPEQYLWIYRRWRYLPANLTPELRQRFPFYACNNKYACPQELLETPLKDCSHD